VSLGAVLTQWRGLARRRQLLRTACATTIQRRRTHTMAGPYARRERVGIRNTKENAGRAPLRVRTTVGRAAEARTRHHGFSAPLRRCVPHTAVFAAWHGEARALRAERQAMEMAIAHHMQAQLRRTLARWVAYTAMRRQQRRRTEEAGTKYRRTILVRAIRRWRGYTTKMILLRVRIVWSGV